MEMFLEFSEWAGVLVGCNIGCGLNSLYDKMFQQR